MSNDPVVIGFTRAGGAAPSAADPNTPGLRSRAGRPACEDWGEGDPFADTIRQAAAGQAPPEIRAQRRGESASDYLERVARWEQTGLNEE